MGVYTQALQWRVYTWWAAGPGVLGDESPQLHGVQGKCPDRRSRDEVPDAEAKCKISVQFLTFSSIAFMI